MHEQKHACSVLKMLALQGICVSTEAFEVAQAVLLSLGGGGLIVFLYLVILGKFGLTGYCKMKNKHMIKSFQSSSRN